METKKVESHESGVMSRESGVMSRESITFSYWLIMRPATAICFFVLAALLIGCSTTRRFGTTIERDENNPCQINIIIQVAVQGTPEDVQTIRSALESCYGQGCFIPCPNDSTKGCMTKATIVVKAYGDIPNDESQYYHYVFMKADDGLPSNAQ